MAIRRKQVNMNPHNVHSWTPAHKNSARQFAAFREVDTLKPSGRPMLVKARRDYLKSVSGMAKAKNTPEYVKAAKTATKLGSVLRNSGGTPTGVLKKAGTLGARDGSVEGIYTK